MSEEKPSRHVIDEFIEELGAWTVVHGKPNDHEERIKRLEYALIDIRQSIALLIEVLKK